MKLKKLIIGYLLKKLLGGKMDKNESGQLYCIMWRSDSDWGVATYYTNKIEKVGRALQDNQDKDHWERVFTVPQWEEVTGLEVGLKKKKKESKND